MKKILVLGADNVSTDIKTSELANKNKSINHGLIESLNCDISKSGYYHTTILDLTSADIVKIAKNFDEVMFLDQARSDYSHQKIFLSTYKLIIEIEKNSNLLGCKVYYKENQNTKSLEYWFEYFKNNKSFCAYPFLAYSEATPYLATCARGAVNLNEFGSIDIWKNNSKINDIRKKMISGEKIPDNCATCYRYEDKGMAGYRTHDSLDLLAKLKIDSVEELTSIQNPYYYEIRVSNKCNLMCRMCSPNHSHLLAKEFELHPKLEIDGQRINQTYKKSSIDQINIETLTKDHLVYLTGGEPMIMPETYKFMRRCIDLGKTDFSLTLGTNGMSLNDTFIELASHFKNGVHFSISIDGYGKVNDYVRWKSNFDQIMSNCHKLQSLGHMLSWNHVPTIWGIHKTHELFEHLSEKFPKVSLYLQYNRVDLHSAFSSPLIDETLKSLERTKETTLYFSDGKDCKSGIDSFYEHYKNYKLDKTHLEKFFTWNDAMDQARNIKLADYIPDLDNCRKLLN
jgi:MoaA/NifB/PqqE/SkfB family radical SAM enzyme